jgi:uncharacterized protein (TIGR00255 family)
VTDTVRSMTGQGHAQSHASTHGDLGSVNVEVRTINNRGFKCSPRLSDSLMMLENKVEALARSMIHRGTVQLSVSWRRPANENLPQVDGDALQGYVNQLQQVRKATGDDSINIDLASLMQLPGVIVAAQNSAADNDQLWDFVQAVVVEAIDNLNQMRQIEGGRMAESLRGDCAVIRDHLEKIQSLTPRSTEHYRERLESKVKRILAENDLSVGQVDLLREVQIYADKVDISEEVTRLDSHLTMFIDVLSGRDSVGKGPGKGAPMGRKLDFVIQEMFRETNTTGSKASDAEISAHVVEIKCAIERMRELVQNLE